MSGKKMAGQKYGVLLLQRGKKRAAGCGLPLLGEGLKLVLQLALDVLDVFVGSSARAVADEFTGLFAIGMDEYDGGVALELFGVLGFQGFVGFLLLGGEFEAAGEVGFNENQIFLGVFLESLGGENFFIEFDTEAAPVGAGEIDQDGLLLGLGFGKGLGHVGLPLEVSGHGGGDGDG